MLFKPEITNFSFYIITYKNDFSYECTWICFQPADLGEPVRSTCSSCQGFSRVTGPSRCYRARWGDHAVMLLLSKALNGVYLGIRGSYSTFWRQISSARLKSSTAPWVKFLSCMGEQLNNRGPLLANEKLEVFTTSNTQAIEMRKGRLDALPGCCAPESRN